MDYIKEFIKPELLVLIPVLYFVGAGIKKSELKDKFIPYVLGIAGVVLAALYVIATSDIQGHQDVAMAVFMAITQGLLSAGGSVYISQLQIQAKKDE
jgi:drug/metabolite transporter (DMT)-like permease